MLKLLIGAAILFFAAIGFYSLFPDAPGSETAEQNLPIPQSRSFVVNELQRLSSCTEKACLCPEEFTGEIECNDCSGEVNGDQCQTKELVICENGQQVDTKYKVLSCE